jgi:hypothetical protein
MDCLSGNRWRGSFSSFRRESIVIWLYQGIFIALQPSCWRKSTTEWPGKALKMAVATKKHNRKYFHYDAIIEA